MGQELPVLSPSAKASPYWPCIGAAVRGTPCCDCITAPPPTSAITTHPSPSLLKLLHLATAPKYFGRLTSNPPQPPRCFCSATASAAPSISSGVLRQPTLTETSIINQARVAIQEPDVFLGFFFFFFAVHPPPPFTANPHKSPTRLVSGGRERMTLIASPCLPRSSAMLQTGTKSTWL